MWNEAKLTILLAIILSCLPVSASGNTGVGTTAASFLEVGVGSRAVAMGGAFVAVANDASGIYWNPAGISRLRKGEFIFEHIDWLIDVNFNHVGVVIPLQRYGSFGAFVTSVTIPRMEVRTVEYADGTGEFFNASNLVFGLSYAKNLTDRFSLGMNVKYISERIWHEQAQSIALDIGTLYHTGLGSLVIGACISNFGSSMQLDGSDLIIYYDADPLIDGNNDRIMGKLLTDEWPLPLNMQFGVSYTFLNSKATKLVMAVDAIHPINNTESVNAGFEWGFFNTFFIRGGYKALGQQDSEEGLTLGGGLRYKLFGSSTIRIDYAYADFGRLEDVQRFTLFLQF
ncbi:MAG: PorV/PorQ family protein [Candidatus Marinimicrobia bacterium]|nr:PorV/PorQ family protein [Candidatus Neomarinimicrobiota bacterium]MCH7763215.1 PorV/PorQ family protein [Candidatus Neomarinimicrobiota bacterium]